MLLLSSPADLAADGSPLTAQTLEIAAMTAPAIRLHRRGFDRGTARLVQSYVDQIAQLPWAQKVLVETAKSGHPRVWTVISAPPFEFQYREPVFQAELAARAAA